ncbi:MAG: efflux RND transporter periplasmic adaptor subunit [Candidatus Hydrogenedentes bacterium]|nr:efflux RND transporter periplasmic adaptor subunit [Candidatus Hydrogenedentota bacterium]
MRRSTTLLTLLVSLGTSSIAQGPPQGPPPPPEVAVITVEPKTVPMVFDYVGVTEASKVVEVRARIQGFLETRDFEEGALVDEGTPLFTIDPRSFKADTDIALARVEQAVTRLKLAEQDVNRLKAVKVPGAIAETDLDKAMAEQDDAAASLRLSKAQLAKAELEQSYTVVKAPLTGFVDKAEKEIGSLVDAGQNSLLTIMRQVDPIYVSFQMSERAFLEWRGELDKGLLVLAEGTEPSVRITLLDKTEYALPGHINFESAAMSLGTGAVELRATFENPDQRLKAGQFVNIHMNGYVRPNTLTVPQRAVSQSPQGAYVYVVDAENKAEFRIIKPGKWTGRDWIVESGLEPGERVVVEGLIKVQPGIPVNPVPYSPEPAPAQAQ